MEEIPNFKKENVHFNKRFVLKLKFWFRCWFEFWKPINVIRQLWIIAGFFINLLLEMIIIANTTGNSIISYIIWFYAFIGLLVSPSILEIWNLLKFLKSEKIINNLEDFSSFFYTIFLYANSILSSLLVAFFYPLFYIHFNKSFNWY